MNGTIVCKFGGSSLADASGFQKAKNILLGNEKRRFAVPSAPGRRFDGDDKVTDLLYRCYQQVEKGEDCAETFAKIEERYLGIARELGLTMDVMALLKDTRAAIERVREKAEAFSSRSAQDDLLALPKGDKSKYVLQTLEYIAAHYADADINITTIARSIGISEGHLSHVFKKETSYTALGYLTLYRIHMARRLLADCRYKVYEVAGMVGYRDVAYFGSTFKKLTGLSPSEYQDRCR